MFTFVVFLSWQKDGGYWLVVYRVVYMWRDIPARKNGKECRKYITQNIHARCRCSTDFDVALVGCAPGRTPVDVIQLWLLFAKCEFDNVNVRDKGPSLTPTPSYRSSQIPP